MFTRLLTITVILSSLLVSCSDDENKKDSTEKKLTEVKIVSNEVVIKEGKSIAMGTFKILSSKLKSAIKSGGPVAGIDVCSSEAMKLTDSISKVYNVELKRISLKNRNPKNVATEKEAEILTLWEKDLLAGNQIKPKVLRNSNKDITFVAPIKLKHQCIVCHGGDEFVSPDVVLKLKEHYPNDKARGYNEGDLRGAWIITFPADYFKEVK